jgi:hypothetical protein
MLVTHDPNRTSTVAEVGDDLSGDRVEQNSRIARHHKHHG